MRRSVCGVRWRDRRQPLGLEQLVGALVDRLEHRVQDVVGRVGPAVAGGEDGLAAARMGGARGGRSAARGRAGSIGITRSPASVLVISRRIRTRRAARSASWPSRPQSSATRGPSSTSASTIARRGTSLRFGRSGAPFQSSPRRTLPMSVSETPQLAQATATADNIVAALLDFNENQIFQSSRRYLYHAVIGAIALAAKQARRARFEDVYQLLLPLKNDVRTAVYQACADTPDLDQTAEFFRTELPQDLQLAGSATAQRLDAPRNKVSGLTGVPPLRRFFNHTSDVALADIIQARDILIVDANMAAIGAEHSKACMHFVLRMLHTQLQRQVRRPETDRLRVALLADEAHYVASSENVVDQIATHRAAGLDVTFGLQYFAQLGSASEHQEKIRKGIVNLLQSRFLFRLGDHEDAEDAVRIAMSVYSTMIRDDPDSRARLRVTPEQILNLPVHYCLASWVAGGTRAASFIGQTFPFPAAIDDTGAEIIWSDSWPPSAHTRRQWPRRWQDSIPDRRSQGPSWRIGRHRTTSIVTPTGPGRMAPRTATVTVSPRARPHTIAPTPLDPPRRTPSRPRPVEVQPVRKRLPRRSRSAHGDRSSNAAPAPSRTTCMRSRRRSSFTASSAGWPPTAGARRAMRRAGIPCRTPAAATSAIRSRRRTRRRRGSCVSRSAAVSRGQARPLARLRIRACG